MHKKIHESEYGESPMNFHVTKHDDVLRVELTYPPYKNEDNQNNQCRYFEINQESVRASDGIRIHYDYERDGFVVEQPQPRLRVTGENSYEQIDDWIEVGFFQSWKFNTWEDGQPSKEEWERAEAEYKTNTQRR